MKTMTRRAVGMLIGGLFIPFLLGGCELECDCNGDDIEEVVDKVGDEVEDTVNAIKKKE